MIKHFRSYHLKYRTKVIVPYLVVRNVSIHKYLGVKHAHWVTTLKEYDMEIWSVKFFHGKGLCKLATQAEKSQNDKDVKWNNEEKIE